MDTRTNAALRATKLFRIMSAQADGDEHSMEMHFPYLRKVFEKHEVSIVPILVGQLTEVSLAKYAPVLAELVADPSTLVVVSSDFCHWGERFRYTHYQGEDGAPQRLSSRTPREEYSTRPIYESIKALDADGMTDISHSPQPVRPLAHASAGEAREAFSSYLAETGNTICGRNPISLLLATLHHLEKQGNTFRCLFTHYEQSGAVQTPHDSSVSYAAGYVQQMN